MWKSWGPLVCVMNYAVSKKKKCLGDSHIKRVSYRMQTVRVVILEYSKYIKSLSS